MPTREVKMQEISYIADEMAAMMYVSGISTSLGVPVDPDVWFKDTRVPAFLLRKEASTNFSSGSSLNDAMVT